MVRGKMSVVAAALCIGGAALAALTAFDHASAVGVQQSAFVGGKAGFVVTHFEYALSNGATPASACPRGLTQGYRNIGDVLPNMPELQRRADETDAQYSGRSARVMFGSTQNLCRRPELGAPDPNFHTVAGAGVPVIGGVNLDGQDSHANGRPAPGTCAHDDFHGASGERGIDNQFFRVVGCSVAFQPDGQSRDLDTEMKTGSWGILITLSGVDDLRNDPDVEVAFYANSDPIELSAARTPLANATYSPINDPRFRATAHGRIVDGVLTTDPVDVRFYSVFNTVRTERPLQDARARLTFAADGSIEGFLGGYTPVQSMYDVQYGFRSGTETNGAPAPDALINTRSIGYAITFGRHTCQGAYYALVQNADGHRDPATGRCSAISTQYHLHAIPAFVADDASHP